MRYSRQELLEVIGKGGQNKLRNSTIAIVGLGALGSVSTELLARAGIGTLILIDRDVVEENNLQRQTLYGERDIGNAKAIVAKEHVKHMNTDVVVEAHAVDLDYKNISLLKNADLILDGTDNLETRFLINEFSIKNSIPWIYAAGLQTKGYVFVINGTPCLNCFLDEKQASATCDTAGVLNSLSATIAAMQVTEALKLITGKHPESDLMFYDIWKQTFEKIKIQKNPNCAVCNNQFEYLTGKKKADIVQFCGSYSYQIKKNVNVKELKKKLEKIGTVKDLGYALSFNNMTVFEDHALIKANTKEEAKSLFSKFIGN